MKLRQRWSAHHSFFLIAIGFGATIILAIGALLTSPAHNSTLSSTPVLPTSIAPRHVVNVIDVRKLSGTVLAESHSDDPNTLKGYRLEELPLPEIITVEVNGQDVALDKVWRISVQGGYFQIGAMSWYIWLDETPLIAGQYPDLSQLSALIEDESLLRDGAIISVSYGSQHYDGPRVELPVPLTLKTK